ncbi:heavy-metal-associated domain-containing protein [Vallitalea okinawensis]|uniref:heavy-metal-associated domain-containing protein n=1 Tax=Vallitalea okinawensis TaxID=2078660 RepID=UPI000CFE0143|nr:heavy metal-associated domain-containing protein [Vallitalea okinawensis]
MKHLRVEVNSIANATSKTQIKNALDKIEGVDEVSVDRAESTIKVEYKEPATEQVIKNTIEHAGHKIEREW